MTRLKIYGLLLFSLIAFNGVAGGGWPQPKGNGFLKFNQFAMRSNRYFNPEGDLIDVRPKISVYTSSLYAEYGITSKLTGVVYFPFFSRVTLNEFQKLDGSIDEGDFVNSLGDADITLKYGIVTDQPTVVSISLTGGIPLGNANGGRTESLQTGDGEFNQMVSLDISHSFYPVPVYLSIMAGVNNRTRNLSDEFRYGFEVGYTYKTWLTFLTKLYGVKSLRNGDLATSPNQGLFSNNVEYLALSPEVIVDVKNQYGFTANVSMALSGQQILASPSFSVGAYLRFHTK
ncbi:MAG: hypothetical protein R8G66_31725 [Cytophagales bacterium]|nr:hypothetical protein [Cytophagales bacterium]